MLASCYLEGPLSVSLDPYIVTLNIRPSGSLFVLQVKENFVREGSALIRDCLSNRIPR